MEKKEGKNDEDIHQKVTSDQWINTFLTETCSYDH